MTAATATSRLFALRRAPALRSRAARGDAAAFAVLYERHQQALYRYCRSILRHDEDARDAVQSAMIRAFAALQDEERDFELRPWLFRIAHNEAIALLRGRRDVRPLEEAAEPAERSLEDVVVERTEVAELRADLAELPDRHRAALVLRELSGLSHEDIAAVLDSTPRAVKQVIFEARKGLVEQRAGRAMDCDRVCRALSDRDGRVLRGRGIRAHLRDCRACAAFQAQLAERPAQLAALAPAAPLLAGAGLASHLAGGGSGVGASATAGGVLATTGAKVAGLAAVAGVAVGGGIAGPGVVAHHHRHGRSAPAVATVVAARPAGAQAAAARAAAPVLRPVPATVAPAHHAPATTAPAAAKVPERSPTGPAKGQASPPSAPVVGPRKARGPAKPAPARPLKAQAKGHGKAQGKALGRPVAAAPATPTDTAPRAAPDTAKGPRVESGQTRP